MAGAIGAIAGLAQSGPQQQLIDFGKQAYNQNRIDSRQQADINYNKWNITNRESAFTDSGLPRFMAYQGANSQSMPQARSHLGGNSYIDTGYVGQKNNSTNTSMQQMMGYGSGNQISAQSPIVPTEPTSRQNFVPPGGDAGALGGQNDRVGLGAGRYSAVQIGRAHV